MSHTGRTPNASRLAAAWGPLCAGKAPARSWPEGRSCFAVRRAFSARPPPVSLSGVQARLNARARDVASALCWRGDAEGGAVRRSRPGRPTKARAWAGACRTRFQSPITVDANTPTSRSPWTWRAGSATPAGQPSIRGTARMRKPSTPTSGNRSRRPKTTTKTAWRTRTRGGTPKTRLLEPQNDAPPLQQRGRGVA